MPTSLPCKRPQWEAPREQTHGAGAALVPHLSLPGCERHAALGEVARRRVDRVVSEHVLAAARADGLGVVAILQGGSVASREAVGARQQAAAPSRPTWLMTRVLL